MNKGVDNSPHCARSGDKGPSCIHHSANWDSRKASLVTRRSWSWCWCSKINPTSEDSTPCSNFSAQEYQLELMKEESLLVYALQTFVMVNLHAIHIYMEWTVTYCFLGQYQAQCTSWTQPDSPALQDNGSQGEINPHLHHKLVTKQKPGSISPTPTLHEPRHQKAIQG